MQLSAHLNDPATLHLQNLHFGDIWYSDAMTFNLVASYCTAVDCISKHHSKLQTWDVSIWHVSRQGE